VSRSLANIFDRSFTDYGTLTSPSLACLKSSVMGQLTSIGLWRQSRLHQATSLRLYNALVVSVLLYGANLDPLLQFFSKYPAMGVTLYRW